jgi:peptidyl-prolyl cis-trans isomerase D
MFDLFRSRAKAVRYLLGAMLMVVALSMVVTLIPGFGTADRADPQIVAEVGGEVLTLTEVHESVQAQIRNRSFPQDMASIFIPQVADQMINEYAVAYQAERMGFQVSPADLATAIRTYLPQLFDGDRLVDERTYAAVLAQQSMTVQQFESSLRRQLFINKLRSLVTEGIVVSRQEAEAEFRRKNDKVKIEYIAIPPAKYRLQVVVKPEEIQNFFDKRRTGFQIPEKRSLQVVIIDEAKLSQSVTVPDPELRRAYEMNKDAYRMPERVHVRHILLKTTDKPKPEVTKLKARAEELLRQIRQGADFAALAKKNSEDTVSAAKGGDLDWIARGQTVKAFEDAAFTLKPKEIGSLITTEYGFHIIQVLEKQEARLRPFEEVKPQLAGERKKQLVFDSMQNLSDQVRAALNKDPQAAEKVARDLNLEFIKADKIGSGDPFPGIGASRELDEASASLRKGDVSPIVQVGPSKLAVAVVTEVFPARQAELAEVENQIRGQLTTEKLGRLVEERAREALEKAKSMNGDLRKAAQALGLDWKAPPEFTRDGAAEGLGAGTYIREAFASEVGRFFGPVEVNGQRFVCKVVDKIPADLSQLAAQRDEIVQQIKSRKARERAEVFDGTLRHQLVKEGKVKIHQDVINRLVASSRGL